MPYVDGLSFLPEDLAQLSESGLNAFALDVSGSEMSTDSSGATVMTRSFEASLRSMTETRRLLKESKGVAFLATRGSEIAQAASENRTAVFFQLQGGGEVVGQELWRLGTLHELGLSVFQLTHHFDNPLAGGGLEKHCSGLTELGKQAVERLDALGMIPDLSHASDLTARDVLKTSRRPVIVSHGAARKLCHNPRCTPDELIRGIADSGGVFGIFMMSFWLTSDPVPRVEHLIAQIRHVINVGGSGAVGIANDYPITGEAHLRALGNDNAEGVKAYHPWWTSIRARGVAGFEELPKHVVIPELNDVRRMHTIRAALERARFTSSEIEKIMGGNWVRVLTDVLG